MARLQLRAVFPRRRLFVLRLALRLAAPAFRLGILPARWIDPLCERGAAWVCRGLRIEAAD
ncbi:hypothetical protein EKE94_03205 [Mesobaculum littorinae]|uniref:Uncharacterized protein n=1 Tax=Mesobaculum littorinae TaxID=2486419 RepID=A0A438ALH4_9RHOB|nr:hypothetical protein [Mesobaculum littorinae]RVV99703.1 hypothetical protein EKE94_03205 [Mesobaculum littorinae]